MLRNFVAILVSTLFFNVDAMRVPSLKTICLDLIDQNYYQNFNLDGSLLNETKKIKKSLEDLPDSLQDEVISHIDFMLCPQWQEVKRTSHEGPSYFESLTRLRSHHMGCNLAGFFVHDKDNDITYQKYNQDNYDPIKKIMEVPNAPLLLGLSSASISFFSSNFPFSFLGVKPLDGEKLCVVSTGEKPVLYVATPHKILTFACDGITDKASIESQSFGRLRSFVKQPDNPILSLALTHNNQFLYVGSKKKCYEICLETGIVEEIPEEGVDYIIISPDDSIVALAKKYKEKTKIITRQIAVDIDGVALCMRNNIILASSMYAQDNLLCYNIQGNLLKKFIIAHSLWDHHLYYFVADGNNLPNLINIVSAFNDRKADAFCVPEKLTNSIGKLAFKMAVEKALDGNRKDVLNRLLADKATLSLFPQPSILCRRIQNGLNAKDHVEEEPSHDVSITIHEQPDDAKPDDEPPDGNCIVS